MDLRPDQLRRFKRSRLAADPVEHSLSPSIHAEFGRPRHFPAVEQRRVLIVGAGGATAGLLGPLLDRQPNEILLLNRTVERAVKLAERFAHRGPIRAGGLDDQDDVEDYDLLLQATSIGHQGQLPPIRLKWLARQATVYDLNYGPAHQPLATWAKAHDLPCHDGKGMLVGQAALAFEIWTGKKPDIGKALKALPLFP
jgi:shikimate dehydrogenase